MKNMLKKISAIAMAFSILGSGALITQYTNSKTGNTLVAIAANPVCQYHDGSEINGKIIINYDVTRAKKTGARYCKCCGQFTGWYNGPGDGNYEWKNGASEKKSVKSQLTVVK